MGSLLAVLHLSPPKALRIAATADLREMKMVEEKGARWVDREVDESRLVPALAPGWGEWRCHLRATGPVCSGERHQRATVMAELGHQRD